MTEMGLVVGQMKIGFKSISATSPILTALESGEKSADELARILKMPIEKLMNEIFRLQLEGLIEEKRGKYLLMV